MMVTTEIPWNMKLEISNYLKTTLNLRMSQRSEYKNTPENQRNRAFLAKSNPQYREMINELYHLFRASK